MQKYSNTVLGQNGQSLVPIAGASVTVFTYPGNTLALIFSDNGVTAIPGSVVKTDSNGFFAFYAANGRYTLQTTFLNAQITYSDIVLENDPVNGQTVVITGGAIDNTPIGSGTPNTGAFTTLSTNAVAAHSVLIGEGSSPMVGAAPGASGRMLLSTGASSDPGFGNNPVITGGTIDGATIGATTPNSIVATTINASGTITPSQTNGIVGTTTNNSANAGSVGEYSLSTFSGVSLTTSTNTNVTSFTLTAGDWDVSGGIVFMASGSNLSNVAAGSSSTSATLGASGTYGQLQFNTFLNYSFEVPMTRYSLASSTTVYMVAVAVFGSGTCTASGLIRARRIR